jgi:hypothetical protein
MLNKKTKYQKGYHRSTPYLQRARPVDICTPTLLHSSPIPDGNPDRLSGKHTIVVPIGASQDGGVEKHKSASLAGLDIYRSGTRKRAEVLPSGLSDLSSDSYYEPSAGNLPKFSLETCKSFTHSTSDDGRDTFKYAQVYVA